MSTHLDLDDVCAGHPLAQRELAALRAEVAGLREWLAKQIDKAKEPQ